MSSIFDRHLSALLLSLAAIASGAAAAAEIYRWTDANGQVHYGQRPPHDVPEVRTLQVPASTESASGTDPDNAQRRERQRRMLEAYRYERERKQAAAAEAAQREQQRAERCRAIQTQWRRLAFTGRVYYKRDDGGRDYLSDEQRAAEQARLRPAYIEACGEEPR